jgi:hypothetical protein
VGQQRERTPASQGALHGIGGSGGGPIYIPKLYDGRNKSFWFMTYSKDKRPITATQVLNTLPTARMKAGDFGEVPQLIYDPA